MLKNRPVYDADHAIFRDAVRKFFAREMMPYRQAWDEAGNSPREFWRKAGAAGILCPQVGTEFGGAGADFRYSAIVVEETFYGGPAINLTVHSDIVAPYLLHYGTAEQQRTWLPRMVSGAVVTAIAMTEPGTGSDLQGVRTTAVADGEDYIVNGQKTFISNGQNADLVIVVAKTDSQAPGAKGISLILVEADRPGFARGRNLKKIGQHAADTSELFFDNVRVPRGNLLGTENNGFQYLMAELPQERLMIAIGAAAAAQYAFDITVDYVKQRRAFGQAIADFQNTRFKLADMQAEIAVGWAYVDQCIARHSAGRLDVSEAAIAKLWLTEMQGRVVDACVQLHGGYGYMEEYPIAKAYVDARAQRIYGGTSEIMRDLISRSI
ncbi:MAG: acyl-CoA dehydrogenase [Alphaproteobacteria bacterium]|nr:MAG: acyl-CoA dehydrogenase [Alphaproteobacteria bacterium]